MIRRDICAALSKVHGCGCTQGMEIAVKHQEDTSSERYTTTLYAKLPVHSMRLKGFLTMLFDYNFKRYNFRILIYVILLSGIGVMAIWSATNQDRSMIAKQIFGIIFRTNPCDLPFPGRFIPGPFLTCFDLWSLRGVSGCSNSYGRTAGGATRWLILPVIGAIQPAEFRKNRTDPVLFLVFSKISGKDQSAHYPGSWSCTVRTSCLYDFGAAEPSTTLVTTVIIVSVVFCSGVSYKWILGVLAVLFPLEW